MTTDLTAAREAVARLEATLREHAASMTQEEQLEHTLTCLRLRRKLGLPVVMCGPSGTLTPRASKEM